MVINVKKEAVPKTIFAKLF